MSSPAHAGVLRLYRALIAIRRQLLDRGDEETAFSAEALDEHTVALARGAHAIVARLAGAGRVSLEPLLAGGGSQSACDVVLTTEDPEFAVEGRQPRVILASAGAPEIHFDRPAALVLKLRSGSVSDPYLNARR